MPQILTASFTQTPPDALFLARVNGPIGSLLVGLTAKNEIACLAFLNNQSEKKAVAAWQKTWPETRFTKAPPKSAAKAASFFGPRANDAALLLVGTPFQHKVWAALLEIPEGFVTSYGAIAAQIKKPRAARAVGGAVGANPVPLLVPCHRVIGSDGSLGGFSCGIAIKKLLLRAEATTI